MTFFCMFPQNFKFKFRKVITFRNSIWCTILESAPLEMPKNQIIEKPIISKKWFIITTSEGGYSWVRSPSHRCGNASDHDKSFLRLHCLVMLETIYVWSPSVQRFIELFRNTSVELQHRCVIIDKIHCFLVESPWLILEMVFHALALRLFFKNVIFLIFLIFYTCMME